MRRCPLFSAAKPRRAAKSAPALPHARHRNMRAPCAESTDRGLPDGARGRDYPTGECRAHSAVRGPPLRRTRLSAPVQGRRAELRLARVWRHSTRHQRSDVGQIAVPGRRTYQVAIVPAGHAHAHQSSSTERRILLCSRVGRRTTARRMIAAGGEVGPPPTVNILPALPRCRPRTGRC